MNGRKGSKTDTNMYSKQEVSMHAGQQASSQMISFVL